MTKWISYVALLIATMLLSLMPRTAEITATPRAAPPTSIGVNVGSLEYWDHERALANLAGVYPWHFAYKKDYSLSAPEYLNGDGSLRMLPPDEVASKRIVMPAGPFDTLDIHCTYTGKAVFSAFGLIVKYQRPNNVVFTMRWSPEVSHNHIHVTHMSTADPIRNFDCREAAIPKKAYFAPEFTSFISNFTAVRFIGWQESQQEQPEWSENAEPRTSEMSPGGVSVQAMVALANESDVDPWFLLPYKANDAYLRAFAEYVHRHLEPGRVAYVELGNEVWNWNFKTTHWAAGEGMKAKLDNDPFRALLKRYAQKSSHMFTIWRQEFADDPRRLVRVVATQSACTEICFKEILDFENTAANVDALAIAPYFTTKTEGRSVADMDQIFLEMNASIDKVMSDATVHKKLADHYHKRLIAYEGGQHIVSQDLALAQALQRDPRMGRLYMRYLGEWQRRVGDRMMLLSATGPIGKFGSWGMREYAGQLESDAPKLAATKAFIARLKSPSDGLR